MDSTRVPESASNSSNTTFNSRELEQLTFNLHSIKEILYFSVCCPEVFNAWVEEELDDESKHMLNEFSNYFLENHLPGFLLSELEVTHHQREIFDKRKRFQAAAKLWRDYINSPLAHKNNEFILRQQLIKLDHQINFLLEKREAYIKTGELILSLSDLDALWIYQVEVIRLYTETLDSIEDYVSAEQEKLDPELPCLLEAFGKTFIELSEAQRRVEKQVFEIRKSHDYIAAIVVLMLEDDGNKLCAFLNNFTDTATFLQSNLEFLQPISRPFKLYLRAHKSLLPKFLFKSEAQSLGEKKLNSEKHYKEVAIELSKQKSLLFEQEKSLHDNYEQACLHYNKKEFSYALNLLLNGSKHLNVPALLKTGAMILSGEGCTANPLRACSYFRAAAAMASNESQKQCALNKLHEAFKISLTVPEERVVHRVDQIVDLLSKELDDLQSKIIASKSQYAKKYFNAAEAYLLQYKLVLIFDKPKPGVACAWLQNACHFFAEAYNFLKHAVEKQNIIHENFIQYVKKNDLNLEGSTAEDKSARARLKEIELGCQEAKKNFSEIEDKIGNKLVPLSLYVDRPEDKKVIANLCLKINIKKVAVESSHIFKSS